MLASDQTASELSLSSLDLRGGEFALPSFDARALARRAAVPALMGATAVALALFAGGRIHALGDVMRRVVHLSPAWALVAVAFESVSILAYIVLLSLVAGTASRRIGTRESAQITLAGTAATRLLPTAGAGGAALALWTLRRSGLSSRAAARTLLAFLVLLYSVFLASIVIAGTILTLGLVHAHGPVALSAIPAGAAVLAIAIALAIAVRAGSATSENEKHLTFRARVADGATVLGDAIRSACALLRTGNLRLLGAVGYWGFDAAVLWATLHAFGASPAVPVVVLAYFVGQLANTLPLPGSVSGGIAGVLIAFGVAAPVALAAVLAYRTLAVWLPTPAALAVLPGFRATLGRWSAEDAASA